MHWHQSFNLSPSPLALSLAQPCHWVHVSRQYLTDPGAQEEKRGEFTSIQLCFPPACSRTDQIYNSYMISLQGLFCKCLPFSKLPATWPSAQYAFYSLSPLVWLWFVFSYLTCYFFQNLILRMLRLGLGHKNNPVSKCFPLWIGSVFKLMPLDSSDNWEEAQGQDQPQSVRAQETRTQCLWKTGKMIRLNATSSVFLYILKTAEVNAFHVQAHWLKLVLKLKPVYSF